MAGRCAGKLALVTGAAQGLGRAHATRLAEEYAARFDCAAVEDLAAAVGEVVAKATETTKGMTKAPRSL